MTETIMPGFDRFRAEGSIIGRLLAGYGELEFEMCRCIEAVTTDLDAAIRSLFQIWNAERRITETMRAASAAYVNAGLGAKFASAMADNLEERSKQPDKIVLVTTQRHALPLALLEHQEAFFKYVQKCFWNLYSEYSKWAGRPANPHWSAPAVVARPRKHG